MTFLVSVQWLVADHFGEKAANLGERCVLHRQMTRFVLASWLLIDFINILVPLPTCHYCGYLYIFTQICQGVIRI